jgi:HK97 family phage portal protein
MSIRERLADWLLGPYKAGVVDSAPAWLRATADGQQFGLPDPTMPEAQSELYQRLSWVQTAVGIVASTASVEKLNVKQMRGEKADHVENHPFETLLRRPNPLMSRFEFLQATFGYLQLTGMAYWWLNTTSESAPPIELWAIPTHQIQPIPDGRMFVRGYKYNPGGGQKEIEIPAHEIVQFRRWHPLSWFTGLSPIEAVSTSAQGDLAMQKWNTNFFDKQHAKPEGALAFADPIPQAAWEGIRADITRRHGGTQRELMMLRNVGSGGVSWVQMGMSQKDMEFLQGRQFTKEEIFGVYAPGLSSILAINATEANSTAGKSTFQEFALWPQMVAVAEKISNDLMPLYGENLVAEFDDVRKTDTAIELAEQEAYARVHTINEVRQQWYEDEPLEDERGEMLAAEISVKVAPTPDMGMDTPQAADMPVEPPESPQDDNEQPEPEVEEEEAKRRETKALKRYIRNRDAPDVTKFDNVYLSDDEVRDVARGCGVAVDAPFPVAGWADYP